MPRAVPLAIIALLLGASVQMTISRGAPDWRVFYHAWSLVLDGRASELYTNSPDRYLYAPGFAWALAPLALLPSSVALALWTALKVFAAWVIAFLLAVRFKLGWGPVCIGFLIWSRAVLIDFQYGQINMLLVFSVIWALATLWPSVRFKFWSWFLLGVLAATKLVLAPVLLIPWLAHPWIAKTFRIRTDWSHLRLQRAGGLAGATVIGALPFLFSGVSGGWQIHLAWLDALQRKGLPLYTHNQSMIAFLHRFFSGHPTDAFGWRKIQLGWDLLSEGAILGLGAVWSILALLGLLTLVWRGPWRGRLFDGNESGNAQRYAEWAGALTLALILPSHLIWKPYFVFAIPLTACWVSSALATGPRVTKVIPPALALLVLNFSSADFVGKSLAASFEAASGFLWMALAVMTLIAISRRRNLELDTSRAHRDQGD